MDANASMTPYGGPTTYQPRANPLSFTKCWALIRILVVKSLRCCTHLEIPGKSSKPPSPGMWSTGGKLTWLSVEIQPHSPTFYLETWVKARTTALCFLHNAIASLSPGANCHGPFVSHGSCQWDLKGAREWLAL